MKDRIPGKPGRVELRYDDGTKVQVTMTRVDEPVEEGTPLCKATLLPDDVCDALGVDRTESTPADALMSDAVSEKVGDIKISSRTDLKDDYLLCNGELFPRSVYPKLHELLKFKTRYARGVSRSGNRVIFANGLFVSQSGEYITYASDPSGSWDSKILYDSSKVSMNILAIIFFKNEWIAFGKGNSDNVNRTYMLHSQDISVSVWPYQSISTTFEVEDAACSSEMIVVAGNRRILDTAWKHYPYIAYATDSTGSWTHKQIVSEEGFIIQRIRYLNGLWVVLAVKSASPGTDNYVIYADRPDGTWTAIKIFNSASAYNVRDIEYANGVWCAVSSNNYIYFSTELNENWERTQINGGFSAYYSVLHAHGKWIVSGYDGYGDNTHACIATTDELGGAWEITRLWEFRSAAYGLASGDEKVVATGFLLQKEDSTYSDRCVYITPALPLISEPDAYAYIRGK